MLRKGLSFEQLSDLYAFRVIVANTAACYRALGIVHTTWQCVPERFKDYISVPKQNDYQSLHTTVIGPFSRRVELQIRTQSMHAVADYGIAGHGFYKDGVSGGSHLETVKRDSRAFAWIRRMATIPPRSSWRTPSWNSSAIRSSASRPRVASLPCRAARHPSTLLMPSTPISATPASARRSTVSWRPFSPS